MPLAIRLKRYGEVASDWSVDQSLNRSLEAHRLTVQLGVALKLEAHDPASADADVAAILNDPRPLDDLAHADAHDRADLRGDGAVVLGCG